MTKMDLHQIGDFSGRRMRICVFLFEGIPGRHRDGSGTVGSLTWRFPHWKTREPPWHPFLRPWSEIDPERSDTNLGLYHAVNCLFCNWDRHSPRFSLPYDSRDHFILSLAAAKWSGVPGVLTPCKDIPVDSSTPKQMVWKEYRGRKYNPLPDSHVF